MNEAAAREERERCRKNKGESIRAFRAKAWQRSIQRGADHFTKLQHQGIPEGVDDALSRSAPFEDLGVHQKPQVFGDIGLRRPCAGDDLPDMTGAVANGLKDAQTHGFAEHFKEGGDGFELLRGEGRGGSGLTHVFMVIYSCHE